MMWVWIYLLVGVPISWTCVRVAARHHRTEHYGGLDYLLMALVVVSIWPLILILGLMSQGDGT